MGRISVGYEEAHTIEIQYAITEVAVFWNANEF
jgi:hypothetical protein